MKKKLFFTLALLLLVNLIIVFPAFAGDKVNLNINSDSAGQNDVFLSNGISMIPVETYARFSGADVEWTSENSFKITENEATLSLIMGEKGALLKGKPVTLPYAPLKIGDRVYIPLRFVSDAFGYDVGWDNQQRLITLNRSETREGMTPAELLVKANNATRDINTYTMEGNIKMNISVVTDGKEITETPMNLNVKLTGQIQNKPMQVYIQQKIVPEFDDKMPEMVVETYMTEEKMYVKAPEQEWVVQDLPFLPEFWEQQQDIQSDPLKAAAQMEEMGILLNFGNDVSINNNQYYVINATLDMDKFRQGYQKLLQQAIQSMPQGSDTGDPELMHKQMQKLLSNSTVDYYYTVYVNKETMITDVIKFEARLDLNMNLPETAETDDKQEKSELPQKMNMKLLMQGQFNIGNLGSSFVAPDVSNAREINPLEDEARDKATN